MILGIHNFYCTVYYTLFRSEKRGIKNPGTAFAAQMNLFVETVSRLN